MGEKIVDYKGLQEMIGVSEAQKIAMNDSAMTRLPEGITVMPQGNGKFKVVNSFQEGAARAEAYINQRLAAAGVRLENKRIIEVIESKIWKNKKTGAKASVYGSAPWTSAAEKGDWEQTIQGFTWRLDDGTVGLGRQPAKTRAEAEEVMKQFNERFSK